jgi:subtilisin family serine protease
VHFYDAHMNPVELELLPRALPDDLYAVSPWRPTADAIAEASAVLRAARAFFGLGRGGSLLSDGPPPAVFRDLGSGLIRTFRREVVVRFSAGVSPRRQARLLAAHRLEVRRRNRYVAGQFVVADRGRKRFGADMVEVANSLASLDEVVFAAPNFVSEYRRFLAPRPPLSQWHLRNLGRGGQKKGEDLNVVRAWRRTQGQGVVVAVLDDGVDLSHPGLRSRLWKNPSPSARDRHGRDFFLPPTHPDHFNPQPKKWRYPYDQMPGNDSHGTPCAGLIAGASPKARGVAPRARLLPVKIFHAEELASDEFVADAIRYAGRHADVLSCSWGAGVSPDLELAFSDVASGGRSGRGCVVVCAAGNESSSSIRFPSSHRSVIAVGACTDQGRHAPYSNCGKALALVAPSNGGRKEVFTTDVSLAGRGFDAGPYTSSFGGTSAAAPMVAGVAALVLSVNRTLSAPAVREVLCSTAVKVGSGYDRRGHSRTLGHGRVDAAAAVAAALARRKRA